MAGNTPTKFRAKVQGTTGRAVHFPSGTTAGAQIGVNLALPDGSIPTLQQLVTALQGVLIPPGNISSPVGASLPFTNITAVPPQVLYPARMIDDEDQGEEYGRMAVPGPAGPRGLMGPATQLAQDDPDDPLVIPGPAGARGPSGLTIVLAPDDPDDPMIVPGVAGAAGAAGATGPAGAPGAPIFFTPDDPDDAMQIPGPAGPQGPAGAGTTGAVGPIGPAVIFVEDDYDIERYDVSGAAVGPNQSFQSLVLNPALGQIGLTINQEPGFTLGCIRLNVAAGNVGAGGINIAGAAGATVGIQFTQAGQSVFAIVNDASTSFLNIKTGGAAGVVTARIGGSAPNTPGNPGGWEIMSNLSIDKPAGNVQPWAWMQAEESDDPVLTTYPLDFAVSPTWTGNHVFNPQNGIGLVIMANALDTFQTAPAHTVRATVGPGSNQFFELIDSYNTFGQLMFRRATGTATNPSAVLSTNTLGGIQARGFGTTVYSALAASMFFQASHNWTDASNPVRILFQNTPQNAIAAVTALTIEDDGGVFLGNTTGLSQGVGTLNARLFHDNAPNVMGHLLTPPDADDTSEDSVPAMIAPGRFSGSFTGTLTGCTTSPTVTITYTVDKVSGIVVLNIPTLTGTSSSTACTITGLPLFLQPASQTAWAAAVVEDASVITWGQVQVSAASGTLTLLKNGAATFTNSATTKGIVNSTISYALT